MRQIALPLSAGKKLSPPRIVIGNANSAVADALSNPSSWPFGTAILFGPPRSGKSLFAGWFASTGAGEAIDNAETVPEDELFHRWNRAQERKEALLLVANTPGGAWKIELPDLSSRLGAALQLEIGAPDDAMLADLIAVHAEMRGLMLDDSASSYLVPRCERSHMAVERLVEAIDRLSLERKQRPSMAIWRDALEETSGKGQPRLL